MNKEISSWDKRDMAKTILIMADDIDGLLKKTSLTDDELVYYLANNEVTRAVLKADPDLEDMFGDVPRYGDQRIEGKTKEMLLEELLEVSEGQNEILISLIARLFGLIELLVADIEDPAKRAKNFEQFEKTKGMFDGYLSMREARK